MILPARELMPVIRAALERGQTVRMTVNGASMLPFIRNGAEVELEPVRFPPAKGDVVLVQCEDERYVLHRVVVAEGEVFFLRGDAKRDCEGPFTLRDALGKATTTYHNGRRRIVDKGIWHTAAVLWGRCVPLNLYLLSVMIRAWRLYRKIIGGSHLHSCAESDCKSRDRC